MDGLNITRKLLEEHNATIPEEVDGYGVFLYQGATVLIPLSDLKRDGLEHHLNSLKDWANLPKCECKLLNDD